MTTKRYGVRFYCGVRGEPVQLLKLSDLFHKLASDAAAGEMPPRIKNGGQDYELRDLISLNGGAVVKGVFAVLRDDAPHIRQPDGSEEPIVLDENAGLIEKNHFIYYSQNEVLVYQINGRASHVSRFEQYLTACTGNLETISLDDILSLDAMQQLQQGVLKAFEFRVAKPRNAALINPADWESGAFSLLSGADASIISVSVRTRSKGNGLSAKLKDVAHRLLDSDSTRKVSVKLSGIDHPIDLMAECLKHTIGVDMDGMYPIPDSMFVELQAAKDSKQAMLDAYFGQGNAALV
jgi:hypothetical protein